MFQQIQSVIYFIEFPRCTYHKFSTSTKMMALRNINRRLLICALPLLLLLLPLLRNRSENIAYLSTPVKSGGKKRLGIVEK